MRLGGFMRLSGLQDNQLSGRDAGLISLASSRINSIQFLRSYLTGVTLERGNVWQDRKDASYDNAIRPRAAAPGSRFPIGPFYFAYGRADTGDGSFYLYLGPRFTF